MPRVLCAAPENPLGFPRVESCFMASARDLFSRRLWSPFNVNIGLLADRDVRLFGSTEEYFLGRPAPQQSLVHGQMPFASSLCSNARITPAAAFPSDSAAHQSDLLPAGHPRR